MKANSGETRESKQSSEDRQARLSKVDGVSLKGDFEQRRAGWGKSENKPAFSECGNTDSFKAQCPIWLDKKKRCDNVTPTSGIKGVPEGKTQLMEKDMWGVG